MSHDDPAPPTRIWSKLWLAGRQPYGPYLASLGVKVMVLCAAEHQPGPELFPDVHLIYAPTDDVARLSPSHIAIAESTALQVAQYASAGHRTFVTCWQGVNRSALVAALALRHLTGWSGDDCCALIQRSRYTFTNKAFRRYLAALPPLGLLKTG